MVDVAEILEHWYAGRPKVEVAAASEWTRTRYASTWPPATAKQWRAMARDWFPPLADPVHGAHADGGY